MFFDTIYFFSLADNDTDISITHLNKAEQIIKLYFHLRLQNTENFALRAPSNCKRFEQTNQIRKPDLKHKLVLFLNLKKIK